MSKLDSAYAQVPNGAKRMISGLDAVSIWSGKAASWMFIPMVGALICEVVMRYFFHSPTIWAMDVSVMLFGANFMLCSPYCLQTGGHIRMDFFYNDWSIRRKAITDIFMYVFFFFPARVWFLKIGWEFFLDSFEKGERSIMSPWMPLVWPMKFAIPLGLTLLLIQGVSETIKAWYRFKTGEDLWSTAAEPKEEC
ncbi:MAG: TRAP transporter small permease subunit [Mailhella sp.]|nr:TRAP transporter small permease subunit [Mailhella sp.]